MALPLLSFTPGRDPLSAGSVRLNSAAICQLLSSFRSSEPIYPLLFFGAFDSPAYTFLLQLLRETRLPEGSNFDIASLSPDSFAKVAEETAAVWPHPVYLGSHACMIIRMWDFDLSETEEETQRALVSLMAVAAYCFVSFDRSCRYRGLKKIQALYEQVKLRTGREIAHFVVLDPAKIVLPASLGREKAVYEASPHATYTTFLPLPSDRDAARFARSVFERFPAGSYVTSHESRDVLWIEGLCQDVEAIVKAASLDMTFERFLDYLPVGARKEANAMQLERMRLALSLMREAVVQPLFFPRDNSHYELDESLLDRIRTNFDSARPTVVLLLLGEQGLGKSTFCNSFIHHCVPTRARLERFREGNTTVHTTKGSQFLSVPVPVPVRDTQLMLVDMEGLEGAETLAAAAAQLQRCLVDCVLAIASVPCFLIRNDTSSIRRVQAYIQRFKRVSDKTGSQIERILLFFHDKDYVEGSGAANPEMHAWIDSLNATFFRGSQVVLLLNKPNFTDARTEDMRRSFFEKVLTECCYPKKGESGAALSVQDLLTQVKYLAQFSYSDIEDIQLSDEEKVIYERLFQAKLAELKQRTEGITSDGQTSIARLLNERIQLFFVALEQLQEKPKVKALLRAAMDEEACKLRGSLSEIENLYLRLSQLSHTQITDRVVTVLNDIYADTFWLPTFLSRCAEQRSRLTRVRTHYPHFSPTIDAAVQTLDQQTARLKVWYGMHYATTIGLTALSFGLGATALTARVAEAAVQYGWMAATAGTSSLAKFASDIGLFRKSPENQVLRLEGSTQVWNEPLLATLANGKNKCSLLIIGSERTNDILNAFVRSHAGIEDREVLTSSSEAQLVAFDYPARNSDCVIFSLQCSSPSDAAMALACCAYASASVTCVFSELESVHLRRILDTPLSVSHAPEVVFFTRPQDKSRLKEMESQMEKAGVRAQFKTGFGREGPDADFVKATLIESIADSQLLPQEQFDELILQLKNQEAS